MKLTPDRLQSRRGITLLFVISLIALFLLMGASFMILANQFRNSTKYDARVGTRLDDSRSLVGRALYDLLREPSLDNINNPLRGHSLLGDQYGYGAKGQINVASFANGTFQNVLEVQLVINGAAEFQSVLTGQNFAAERFSAAYNGYVWTFLNGPLAGYSSRIMHYDVDSASGIKRFYLQMPSGSFSLPAGFNPALLAGGEVLINNRDFSGTGAGIFRGDPLSGRTSVAIDQPALTNYDDANPALRGNTLLPNLQGVLRNQMWRSYMAFNDPPVGNPNQIDPNSRSTNEEYDAVDYQNMFLGAVSGTQVAASFHRPELAHYHQRAGGLYNQNDMTRDAAGNRRRDTFLADRRDAAGNAFYQDNNNDGVPDSGFDVDNDGDGVLDSYWMDTGLPIQTDDKGRRLKPLVSYRVLDMDGRLNLNVHGNSQHPEIVTNRNKSVMVNGLTGGVSSLFFNSTGAGYGPAEINLSNQIQGPVPFNALAAGITAGAISPTEYQALLTARYGPDGVPGRLVTDPNRIPQGEYKMYDYPLNSFANAGLLSGQFGGPTSFSSAMDIFGRFGWLVDDYYLNLNADPYDAASPPRAVPYAMPSIDTQVSTLANERLYNPYDFDVANAPFTVPSATSGDQPFTATELERILRRNDWDSQMLPNRLANILQTSLGSDATLRNILTTDSFEVPIPSGSLVDRLRETLIAFGGGVYGDPTFSTPPTPAQEDLIRLQIELMLPAEVIRGGKMNLNFPFGNGFDNNGDGVVDDPDEPLGAGGEIRPDSLVGLRSSASNILMDFSRDGTADAGDALMRQYYARHLYVMILLTTQFVDRNGDGAVDTMDWFDYDGMGGVAFADLIEYRKDVAQWVANIVDFRDADSIMTGFEFDLNPWDGWGVDGIIQTNTPTAAHPAEGTPFRYVVWGSERPELLLTETLAMHDRRTQDLNSDNGAPSDYTQINGNTGADEDLDSALVPTPSFFVELYNPNFTGAAGSLASANSFRNPGELYGANGINLQQESYLPSPSGNDPCPVWRVVVSRRNPAGNEEVIRKVYFTKPADARLLQNNNPETGTLNNLESMRRENLSIDYRGHVFYPNLPSIPEVRPGTYAVVGSSGIVQGGRHTTYIGRRNTPTWDTELNDTRRISLVPGSGSLELRWWDETANAWNTTTRNNLVVVPVGLQSDGTGGDVPRSLGVTDPDNGYLPFITAAGGVLSPVQDGFEIVDGGGNPLILDRPLDDYAGSNEWQLMQTFGSQSNAGLIHDGLRTGARRVYLERLADPRRAWDPDVNPYVMVDAIGCDVATFNGVTNDDEVDPMNVSQPVVSPNPLFLAAFERSSNDQYATQMTLWRSDLNGRTANPVVAAPPFVLPAIVSAPPGDEHFINFNVSNSLGEPDLGYRQDPANKTFPWLVWNNRPFVSHLELLNVPRSAPDRLHEQFGIFDPSGSAYQKTTNNLGGKFPHLVDLYADNYSQLSNPVQRIPSMQRLLEYVEVPSRFVGTTYELDPYVFTGQSDRVIGLYNAPYNSISRFREPGKINLNTVFDPRVWNGLMGVYSTGADGISFNNFRGSRDLAGGFVATSPVSSVNLFRSPEKGNFVPLAGLVQTAVNTGLLRPLNPGNTRPLLAIDYSTQPIFADSDRNAYFRHDATQRLANLTTTRSSVFAVWVTVGFFEVDENGNIRDEYGADGGDVIRHRGFYMIDRSIPVGFEPGKNHNVDRCILTSSIID